MSDNDFDALYNRDPAYYGTEPSGGVVDCYFKHVKPQSRVLDVGCGHGRNSIWLAQQGCSVTAIDTSIKGLHTLKQEAAARNLPITTEQMDVTKAPIPHPPYDYIVVLTTLNHISADHIPTVVANLIDALASDGVIYCLSFTTDDPGYRGESSQASECANMVVHYFKPGRLKELFSSLRTIYYSEYIKEDTSHGPVHYHGKAKLIGRRTVDS